MSKVVYIAHPVGGDVEGNLKKVLAIIGEICLTTKDIFPIAPYVTSCYALDDRDPKQRQKGMEINLEFFNRKFIDELWLYGDTISPGMLVEIRLAQVCRIPIFAQTDRLRAELLILLTSG